MSDRSEYDQLIESLENSIRRFHPFRISFMNAKDFMGHIQYLIRLDDRDFSRIMQYVKNIDVSGYFSEGVCDFFVRCAKRGIAVRLITRRNKMDGKTFAVLKRMQQAGVSVKTNERMHARMLIAYAKNFPNNELILGSFDFNREGLSAERRDCGIRTQHPDLVKSAIAFFENVWNEAETKDFQ